MSFVSGDCGTFKENVCKLDSDLTYNLGCKSINDATSKTISGRTCGETILSEGEDCVTAWLSWWCSFDCPVCGTDFKVCRSVKQKLKNKCPKSESKGCFKFAVYDNVSDGDNCRDIEADYDNFDTSFIDSKSGGSGSSSSDKDKSDESDDKSNISNMQKMNVFIILLAILMTFF